MSQFTGARPNLADYISLPGYYPAGRLDKDSEGLLLLTNDGKLQARISHPNFKMEKTYLVQVEGEPGEQALEKFGQGVVLKDGRTKPAKIRIIDCPLPRRNPDIRVRKSQPTSWLEISISEGKNRQVRRMTAAIGHPTLRLYRSRIGPWSIDALEIGDYRKTTINL